MQLLVVDNGSLTTHLIARRAVELGWQATIVDHRRIGPRSFSRDCDAIVLSGTEVPVTTGRFDAQLDLVHRTRVPVLGICGGLHLIARAHGVGIVAQAPAVGRTTVSVDVSSPLFYGMPPTVQLFQRHRYRIERIPPDFRCIATSRSCPAEGIAHAARPIYGVQSHLELRSDGARVLSRFLALAQQTPAAQISVTNEEEADGRLDRSQGL